jgi:hypothetical protein
MLLHHSRPFGNLCDLNYDTNFPQSYCHLNYIAQTTLSITDIWRHAKFLLGDGTTNFLFIVANPK